MTNIFDRFRLDGKVALVTGGAGLLGAAISKALGEAGATVIIASRDVERCHVLAAELVSKGSNAEGIGLDLSSESSIRALRDHIVERHNRLDVLFNNAVARAGGTLDHMTPVEWETAMRVNSTGLFIACQIFSEPMRAQRRGSIINIGSIYGIVGPTFSIYEGTQVTNPINYSFAKGGLISLTRYLASFLAPYQIRVNCLSPGGVKTAETPAEFTENYSRNTLLGRMGTPEDVQGPALFLASEASSYVTGQNLVVDGGWTAT
jgi:NAD(P)-dependent dehydrogenase (short-subunit alcohol dehydrogenase family)